MYCFDYNDSDDDSDEEDIELIMNNIISNMKHLIFYDLTTGRSDNDLEPYTTEQINDFIDDNKDNIETAAHYMFNAYDDENGLHSLKYPRMDLFQEFLYEYVNTRTWIDSDTEDNSEDENEESEEDNNSEENEESEEDNNSEYEND